MCGSRLCLPVTLISDHCAVVMSVHVPEVPSPDPGVWKLGLSFMDDSDSDFQFLVRLALYAAPFSHPD